MTAMKKLIGAIALLVVVIAIGAGLYLSARQRQANESPLVIGGPSDVAMLVAVARDRGLFQKYGVNAELRYVQTGKIAQDALISGDLDVGVIVDTNVAFIGYQGPAKIKVLASIQEQHGDGIIARADHGIRTPAALNGKTIGYVPATTSHVFLAHYAEKYGIDLNRTKLLAMAPPALQSAIVRGDVDAVSVFQPFRYNAAAALGNRAQEFTDRDLYTVYGLLAVRDSVLQSKRKQIAALLKALIEAESVIANDPQRTVPMLAREVGVTPAAMRAMWSDYTMRVRFDDGMLNTILADGRWIHATQEGFKDRPLPAYASFMDPNLLREVDPNRVTIRP